MSNNFLKKNGRLENNPDIPRSNISAQILESYNTATILKSLKAICGIFGLRSTSVKCMDYYISPSNSTLGRESVRNEMSLTELFALPTKRLTDISRKNYSSVSMDYLVFYGYDAMSRGNLYKYTDLIKKKLIENVRYAVKNNRSKREILKFYDYQVIPEIIRNKESISDNDFYFAVGDGNYLYGQVHTLNERKREFQILYVLYDEYNWDDNVTYFIKLDTKNGPYRIIIETAAFKKLEKSGLAKPFLQFFIDTYTVSY